VSGKQQHRTHPSLNGGKDSLTLLTFIPIEPVPCLISMLTRKRRTKLRAVSRSRPCSVCGGDHKCSRGADGLILCGRRSGLQPGFFYLGQTKDGIWGLYRYEDDPVLWGRECRHIPAPKPLPHPSVDWPATAEGLAGNLTPALADELCERLGLPRLALDTLPLIGYDPASGAWTFPEKDGVGRIIGLVCRFRDGSKKAMPGSQRGLTVPVRWSERGTPLLIVEGQSDTLALSLCAVSAIGRPSNSGGVEMLAELLADFPLDRPVIVLGENDQKPDGKWPGKDGAIQVASALAEKLQRRISWTLPPDGAKDIRSWILSQKPISNILDSWHEIGEQLWL
jgi:putative DNA primase/helicase